MTGTCFPSLVQYEALVLCEREEILNAAAIGVYMLPRTRFLKPIQSTANSSILRAFKDGVRLSRLTADRRTNKST